jgi:thiol-disulfide isomerase/thioredoxin
MAKNILTQGASPEFRLWEGRNMRTLNRLALVGMIGIVLISSASWSRPMNPGPAGRDLTAAFQEIRNAQNETIHVVLHRVDNVLASIFQTFDFDQERAAKAVEKYKVILPKPFPANTRVVLCYSGPLFGLLENVPGQPNPRLILDVNMNRDLTDDATIDLPLCKNLDEGIITKIARTYSQPAPHTEWLPYCLGYAEDKGRDGEVRGHLFIIATYRYDGEFRLKNHDYGLRLIDGDANGHFYREKEGNVNIQIGLKSDLQSGGGEFYRFQNRIPLEEMLYEFKGIAEDGSWIELEKSALPVAALGKPAPDLQMTDTAGQSFRVSDYKGKVLLLDFWASWCKPCIAQFPDIKRMIQRFEKKPLAVVGINVDVAERVEAGKKVMADYQLTWRQIIEGKGLLHPVCQVFGRLPERGEGFPMYIAIDERGIARYATTDYKKMERFLDAHFNDPKGPDHTFFIPCADRYASREEPRPTIKVDFTSRKVLDLVHSGRLKMPDGLPEDVRVGLLPNGIVVVAYSGPTSDKVRLLVDSNQDFDLTKEKGQDIPVLSGPAPDVSKMVEAQLQVHWSSGGIAFLGMPFYAKSVTAGAPPEVYGLGHLTRFEGTFFVGPMAYALEILDLNGDRLLTEDDTSAPGFLRLNVKKGDDWVLAHEGTSRIPIGGSFYSLKFVSDDGFLVELEKEK